MPPWVDRLSVGLARLLLRIFFRRIEILGLDRIPDGPLVIVANHVNGLVDPLLLFATLPVRFHLLGKSTLWDIKPLRPLLALGRVLPVYRRQDGMDTGRNEDTFVRSHDLLARGGALCLFPEGKSHNEPGLEPLRTGAARILIGAEERFGPTGVRVLPVGLAYDDKERFRSRVLVEVGEPFDPFAEGSGDGSPEQVRALTARMSEALGDLVATHGSWDEAELIAQAGELLERRSEERNRERNRERARPIRLARFVARVREVRRAYGEVGRRFPEETAAAVEALRSYHRLLRAMGLTDRQAAASYALPTVLGDLARTLGRLVLRLPLGLVGALLNWPPYRFAGWLAGRRWVTQDVRSTYKLFPSLVSFPLYWLAVALAVGWRFGLPWGLLAALVAVPTGRIALDLRDRWRALLEEGRAFVLLRGRRSLARELRARRTAASEAVHGLAVRLEEGESVEPRSGDAV